MSHLSLPALNAAAAFDSLQSGDQVNIDSSVLKIQSPNWYLKTGLDDLLGELLDLHAAYGILANSTFESRACVVLHSNLVLSADAAADPGFWRWLSLGPLLPVIKLRHLPLRPEHVGLGSPWDALLSRLWFRADLSVDPADEYPYALSVLGDLDFWRSHVLRADYSSCRQLLRALIRFQFPKENDCKPRLKPSGSSENGMRALAKRIKLRHAVVAFELLDEAECRLELETLAKGLI